MGVAVTNGRDRDDAVVGVRRPEVPGRLERPCFEVLVQEYSEGQVASTRLAESVYFHVIIERREMSRTDGCERAAKTRE